MGTLKAVGTAKVARWAALPAVAAIALSSAGCGIGGHRAPASPAPPAPAALMREAVAAFKHASGVRMTGTWPYHGQTMRVDLGMTRSGGLFGRISVNGAGYTVLRTHGRAYFKPTRAFLNYVHAPSAACRLECGKYLKVPASQTGGLTAGLSMRSLARKFESDYRHDRSAARRILKKAGRRALAAPKGHGTPSGGPGSLGRAQERRLGLDTVGTAAFDGQTAWVLRAPDGSRVYVASQGTPYLLRVTGPRSRHVQVNFTNWGSVLIPPPPPASQIVNPRKLQP